MDVQLNMIKFHIFYFYHFIIETVLEYRTSVSVGHFGADAYFIIKLRQELELAYFAWHK